jgi:hypothetical protein
MLGYDLAERSYVAGFGHNPPRRIHHKAASCPTNPAVPCTFIDHCLTANPNPNILYGALVGGPSNGEAYTDDRNLYQQSEAALDYNAGFTGLVAAMQELSASVGGDLPGYCAGTTQQQG